ncbi:hypothetical protein H2200_010759 [Cladophialophora chaetospira]|uniref:Uncharacterized protein n=1 Tax=Cladophialophora chaetospira TaxID=386627 RepID=A0AA38X0S2_9EURO|nr:hypothetical protein H2200_010759 [Cladophialophora chaetospira]
MQAMDPTQDPYYRFLAAPFEPATGRQLFKKPGQPTALEAKGPGANVVDLEAGPQVYMNSKASSFNLSSDSSLSVNNASTLNPRALTPISSDAARSIEPTLGSQAFTPSHPQPSTPSCQNVITAYERALAAKDDLIELLRTQNLDSHDKWAELVRKCEGLKAKCHALTQERLEEKGVYPAMRTRCESYKKQCKELEEKCESLDLARQKATEELATYHGRISKTEAKCEALQETCERSQQELNDVQKRRATLEQCYEIALKDMRDLQKKCNDLEDRCVTLEAKCEQKEAVIVEQKASIDNIPATERSAQSSHARHAPDPEVFSGDRDVFERWLSQLQSKVETDWMTDEVAVYYAVSRTAGPAFEILMQYSSRFTEEPLRFEDVENILQTVYACKAARKGIMRTHYRLGLLQRDDERFYDFYRRWLVNVETLEHSELEKVVGLKARLNQRLQEGVNRFPNDCRTLQGLVKLCRELDAHLC